MKFITVLYCSLLPILSTANQEYIYPVGPAILKPNGINVIYLLYQRSLDHLEFYEWDPITNSAQKALLSTYSPAFVTMLPDMSGFSFVDKGRIRVKTFEKRSPQTIALYAPIDTITSVEWIDNAHCYFSGRLGQRTAIFSTDLDGTITTELSDDSYDFLYPQYRNDALFFIRRSITGEYTVGISQQQSYATILDFQETPIAFLRMIDHTRGYVIQHQPFIDRYDSTAAFSCWYIHYNDVTHQWTKPKAFDFSIPTELFYGQGSERFYESIVPLLPRYIDDTIYFTHFDTATHTFGLHSYGVANGSMATLHTFKEGYTCCAPAFFGGLLFYGGTVVDATNPERSWLPTMTLDEDNTLFVFMPYVTA